MLNENCKTVGIIGGMGPEATVELMRRVIELTPANDDSDHIRMLVDNNPKVPSRMKALIDGTGKSPAPVLIAMAQGLEKSGADFLVMPCNTAHHYYLEISQSISIPFINMIELAVKKTSQAFSKLEKISLFATSPVKDLKLYENSFEKLGIQTIYPLLPSQENLMQIIKSVKNKSIGEKEIESFKDIVYSMNADHLLIACTELSLLSEMIDNKIEVIDALDLLAQEVVSQAT